MWATSLQRLKLANCLRKARLVDVTLLGTYLPLCHSKVSGISTICIMPRAYYLHSDNLFRYIALLTCVGMKDLAAVFTCRNWSGTIIIIIVLFNIVIFLPSYYNHHEGITKIVPSHCRWRDIEEQNNWSPDVEFCTKISHIYVRSTEYCVARKRPQSNDQSFILQNFFFLDH